MSILLSLQAVGSQAADQMPDLTAVTLPTEAEINVIDLAFKGGWIMVVLLLLSLMAIYIFVQRLIIIRRAGKEDETFMNRIKDYIHEGKVDSALNLCRSTNTPSARMIEKGITRLGRPMNDVLVAIENVGNLEIAKLEKGFPLIATTAAGAPMLGFLGTVTGMVRAFFDMANAGTNVDVSLLSGGIYVVTVDNPDGSLMTGSYVTYSLVASENDNCLVVPIQCVKTVPMPDGTTGSVLFVKGSRPDNAVDLEVPVEGVPDGFWAVPVETGISDTYNVEIKSGVEEGAEVFTQVQTESSWV